MVREDGLDRAMMVVTIAPLLVKRDYCILDHRRASLKRDGAGGVNHQDVCVRMWWGGGQRR
ncbi:MAG: hypothetical protein KDD43_16615, partial [Bdellovibrionales bacterium]|nr:hypothetical protein [Bdellovibrionales bacterium]